MVTCCEFNSLFNFGLVTGRLHRQVPPSNFPKTQPHRLIASSAEPEPQRGTPQRSSQNPWNRTHWFAVLPDIIDRRDEHGHRGGAAVGVEDKGDLHHCDGVLW